MQKIAESNKFISNIHSQLMRKIKTPKSCKNNEQIVISSGEYVEEVKEEDTKDNASEKEETSLFSLTSVFKLCKGY